MSRQHLKRTGLLVLGLVIPGGIVVLLCVALAKLAGSRLVRQQAKSVRAA